VFLSGEKKRKKKYKGKGKTLILVSGFDEAKSVRGVEII
jgi:hypothetical protein